MKRALTKTREKHITFMFISDPDKGVKRIRVNKAFLKCTALFVAVFFFYSIALSTGYLYLDNNHRVVLDRIEHLENDNRRQSVEITSLYNYSDMVRGKMEEFIEFDGEVRSMIGLESDSEKRMEEFQGIFVASRGSTQRQARAASQGVTTMAHTQPVMMSSANQLRLAESVQVLSGQMDIQYEQLDKLLTDVDARLKYLEARPSFLPVSGTITSRFGGRKHPFSRRYQFHEGVDIAARSGTSIRAPGRGVVTFSGTRNGYGRIVVINHGYGIVTRYAHNSSNLVKAGETVSKGQIIARVGSTGISTGPHVHFEVEVNGKIVDPIKFVNSSS